MLGEGAKAQILGLTVGMGIGQVSQCQAQPVGLKQGVSDDIIGPRPHLQVAKLKDCAKFQWNSSSHFVTMSEGIVMRYAHTSQWAESSPPKLPLPGGRGLQVSI